MRNEVRGKGFSECLVCGLSSLLTDWYLRASGLTHGPKLSPGILWPLTVQDDLWSLRSSLPVELCPSVTSSSLNLEHGSPHKCEVTRYYTYYVSREYGVKWCPNVCASSKCGIETGSTFRLARYCADQLPPLLLRSLPWGQYSTCKASRWQVIL